MDAISSYKKQFRDASKRLANDEKAIQEIDEQMESLRKRRTQLVAKVEEDRQNKAVKGMLYYSDSKRRSILDRAEQLRYSPQAIERLRSFGGEQWNIDNVDLNVIKDYETVEEYIKANTPDWEKTIWAVIGKVATPEE